MAKAYEVVFKYETNAQKKAVANDETAKKQDRREKSFAKGAESIISYAAVKGTAEQLIQAEIGRVELRTGASEYQQRLQSSYNIVSGMANSAVALGIGAATGNLPLALIGTITSLFSTVLSGIQKDYTLRLEQRQENISIGIAAQRASTGGRRQ